MDKFKVGDLVRDSLNLGDECYGLGVVVATDSAGFHEEEVQVLGNEQPYADQDIPGKRYDVYFNKFERTITFHGDYLEKV